MTHKIFIVQKLREFLEGSAEILNAFFLWQRLAVNHGRTGLHKADDDEQYEDAAPVGEEQHLSADDGREDRREAVDHHEDGEEARELDALGDVSRDGTCDDDAARTGKAHEEAQHKEGVDVGDGRAAERCQREDGHACEERPFSAVAVGDRAHDHLSRPHAEHRHRQRHLRDGGRDAEIGGKLRQGGEIHVGRKRSHRAHHAEENREEETGLGSHCHMDKSPQV